MAAEPPSPLETARDQAEAPRQSTADHAESSAETAGDSLTVAAWTIISRVTGAVKIMAIGATLGPTYFGNTFQFTNSLPNLVYYGFFAGTLFSSLLVPALVGHIDRGDQRASARVAGGFLGVAWVAVAAIAPLAVLLGPLFLRVAAGSAHGAVGAAQEHVGRLLVLMFIPQVFCYAVVGTSTAVMNAHRRFALAAAAPALENIGMIAVLAATAVIYGTGTTLDRVPTGELLLLGLGTTAAVAVHATAQWWGARRTGVLLLPRAGWRDPEVRTMMRRAVPSLGNAALLSLQMLLLLLLANRVAGGVVALQIGLNFYYLASALGTTPVALSLLPRLARLHVQDDLAPFHAGLVQGLALSCFVTIPATVGLAVLAAPLARAVAFGQMGTSNGAAMIAAAIVGLAPAVVAQTFFMIATYGSYARTDTKSPLVAMVVQTAAVLPLLTATLFVGGVAVVLAIGLAYSSCMALSAWYLTRRVTRPLPPTPEHLRPSIVRVVAASLVMAVPVWVVGRVVPTWVPGDLGVWIALVGAAALGCVLFLGIQARLHAPEVTWVIAGAGRLVGRRAPRVAELPGG